ncbi:MAG: SDR family oxidoreductase [Xanthomonadales bacterium]|nr:SDR family oxidoreductase [Xanthomonadales bacterium]
MSKHILIIGATSAIAEASARLFAKRGDALLLVARDTNKLQTIAADLALRGAPRVETATLDVIDFAAIEPLLDQAFASFGVIDIALIAHGSGSRETECLRFIESLRREFDINATATLALMAQISVRMEKQRHGNIAVISSVAGDRGRASNMLYGSAKAAVNAYASGLRQRLHKTGINVLTIEPGWIDTPMTAKLKKTALFVKPERIAPGIVRAIDKRRSIVYLPWFWRPIMFVVRHVPEIIFRRLEL